MGKGLYGDGRHCGDIGGEGEAEDEHSADARAVDAAGLRTAASVGAGAAEGRRGARAS